MNIDMTKVANVILYMLHKQTKHLTDKKVSVMLFLIDFNHMKFCGNKIFNDEYIKLARQPQPTILNELFEIIANNEELSEDDARLFLIQELLEFVDIEIIKKRDFVELKFLKLNEEFDESLFLNDEMKTIHKIVSTNLETTPRNIANECFKLEEVRNAKKGDTVI